MHVCLCAFGHLHIRKVDVFCCVQIYDFIVRAPCSICPEEHLCFFLTSTLVSSCAFTLASRQAVNIIYVQCSIKLHDAHIIPSWYLFIFQCILRFLWILHHYARLLKTFLCYSSDTCAQKFLMHVWLGSEYDIFS